MLKGSLCLVAGGTGFIGTNLTLRLLAEGAKVRATGLSRNMRIEHPNLDYLRADLTDKAACKAACQGADYVFMSAANTAGAAVMTTTPLVQVTPNVIMNTLLLEAAYEAGVQKFLFISSSAAYPPNGDLPVREEQMFDADPYPPYHAVGWMKRYAEILCKTYATWLKKPMPVVVVRPGNVFGPFDKFDFGKSHMMAALLRRVAERHAPLEVWGTGEDVRDLIYIDDFVDGLMLAFKKDAPYYEVNICSGNGISVKDVLAAMIEVDGFLDADVRFDPTKPQMVPKVLIDGSQAKRDLGFEPKIPLKEGIRRTLAWFRENYAA